ncbi:adenosylcobinamide amidohydrolase [Sphaerisporangium rhizosphaerae]|uniref:Adenosylcobinamide amidohydrolase n=1 Tax=Sphaerisporangium rhizosphaerae TaxID=2269375 RepID=A0ABW2NZD3_9ACTN
MLSLSHRHEDGARLACLLWRLGPGWRAVSSAMLGGGIGPVEWVLNAQVVGAYSRMDPVAHLLELAPPGRGVGMLTAASVADHTRAHDGGVDAVATVGLRVPTWAASPEGTPDPELRLDPESRPAPEARPDPESRPAREPRPAPQPRSAPESGPASGLPPATGPYPDRDSSARGGPDTRPVFPAPGTINIIVAVPVAMSDAALVNAVMTVTEAKAQALAEAGYACTGTASDAVCVAVRAEGPEEPFGGPRSTWGARVARAVHRCVLAGAHAWPTLDHTPASPSRPLPPHPWPTP